MVKKVDNPFHGQPNSKPHQTKNNKRKVFIIGGIIAIGVFFLNSFYDEDYDVHLETTKNKPAQMSQENANAYTPSFQQDMTSLATPTVDTNSFLKNNEDTDAADGSISADPDGEQDETNDVDGDKDTDGSQSEDPGTGTDATGTDAEDSTATVADDTEAKDAVDGEDKPDVDGEAKTDVNDQEKPEEKKDPHLYVKEEQTPDLNEKKPADPNAVNNMDEGYYQKVNTFKAANGVNETVNATATVSTDTNATFVNVTTANATLAENVKSANSTNVNVSVNVQGTNGTVAGNKTHVVDGGNSTKTDANVTVVVEKPQTTALNNITTVSNDTLAVNSTTTTTEKASSMMNETSTTPTSATNSTNQTITATENKEDKDNAQTTNSTESSVRSTLKDEKDKPEETTTNTEESKEEQEKVLLELCKSDIFGESFEQSFDELQQKLDEYLESKNMEKIQTVDNVDVTRQDTEDSIEGTTKETTQERKFLRGVRFLQEESIQNTAENNTEPEVSTVPIASCKSESSVLLSGLCGGQFAKDKSNNCEYYVAYGGTTPDDLTAKTAFEVLAENSNCNVNVVPLCGEEVNAKLSSEALIGDRAMEESVKSRIRVVADTCLEAKEMSSRDDPTEDTSEGIVAKPAPLETELLYIDLTGSPIAAATFLGAIEGERLHLVNYDVEKDVNDIYLPKQIVFIGTEDEKIILDSDLQLKLMNMGYIVLEPNIGPLSLIRVKCPKAPASIGGSASFVTAGFPMR